MNNSMSALDRVGPLLSSEKPKAMAKAVLRKAESDRRRLGRCLDYARHQNGWNLDELAAKLGKDARQVKRWIDGDENTQVDVVIGVPELHGHFAVALAATADDCEVEMTVRLRIRRRA